MDALTAKLIELAIAVLDNLIIAVPALIGMGLVPYVMARMKKRTKAMTSDIEDWAVDAERELGRKKGPEKFHRVKTRALETYPMARHKTLDALISGPGTDAANEFRDSLPPPDPAAN